MYINIRTHPQYLSILLLLANKLKTVAKVLTHKHIQSYLSTRNEHIFCLVMGMSF